MNWHQFWENLFIICAHICAIFFFFHCVMQVCQFYFCILLSWLLPGAWIYTSPTLNTSNLHKCLVTLGEKRKYCRFIMLWEILGRCKSVRKSPLSYDEAFLSWWVWFLSGSTHRFTPSSKEQSFGKAMFSLDRFRDLDSDFFYYYYYYFL